MSRFDTVVVVDWSARAAPSPAKPSADAIWLAEVREETTETHYLRTRAAAQSHLAALFARELSAGRRVLAGFDFPFGYPAGFAKALTGQADPFALWQWLAKQTKDADDNTNNRFDLASQINRAFPGVGPFWGRPDTLKAPDLPSKGSARQGHGMAERRGVEAQVPRAQPVWKLYTTGSVGSQALLGIPRLQALRARFGKDLAVWPFQAPDDAPIVLAEVYPSLVDGAVTARMGPEAIKDEVQVRALAEALWTLDQRGRMADVFAAAGPGATEEAWILGVGAEEALQAAALAPRLILGDCFALPRGVEWLPVTKALNRLEAGLRPVVGTETLPLAQAGGTRLAHAPQALRANPPAANAAVDGIGFAHASLIGPGPHRLPLVAGRAAAGAPFQGAVPPGHGVPILTGAVLPQGVDTIVLQEDTRQSQGFAAFAEAPKPGANTRNAGEDVTQGTPLFAPGHALRPPDLALLAATGVAEVSVYSPLTVGVLSTGDELADPAPNAPPSQTFDANRPMLLDLMARWGHSPLDLGQVGDDRDALRARLDKAAAGAQAIVISGGASGGEEDHVSALLRAEGKVTAWRIALKPGRPLALGHWRDVPVFGLPGNPVAALVCSLIFARPALSRLAGGPWLTPQGFQVPAAFAKAKKPGRVEYLRARLDQTGAAEVFASEGSGRISGLAWAGGLVALPQGAATISPGDPVTFLPYASFGITQ